MVADSSRSLAIWPTALRPDCEAKGSVYAAPAMTRIAKVPYSAGSGPIGAPNCAM